MFLDSPDTCDYQLFICKKCENVFFKCNTEPPNSENMQDSWDISNK